MKQRFRAGGKSFRRATDLLSGRPGKRKFGDADLTDGQTVRVECVTTYGAARLVIPGDWPLDAGEYSIDKPWPIGSLVRCIETGVEAASAADLIAAMGARIRTDINTAREAFAKAAEDAARGGTAAPAYHDFAPSYTLQIPDLVEDIPMVFDADDDALRPEWKVRR